jgi:hypothetical protein
MLRARCASKEQLSNYFKKLGTIMTQNGLHDKPHKIYNIDESALQTELNQLMFHLREEICQISSQEIYSKVELHLLWHYQLQ